jgi:4-hydroxybenzoate polyprenyltransferase
VANAVASYLGCFDGVIAAEPGGANLTGRAKRDELVGRFGERGFSYIGNSGVDLPSWRAASEVIVTAPTIAVRAAILTGRLKPDRTVARRTSAAELIRAMRPFHWAKNLLIFVPLLTSHQFANAKSLLQALACFCAFNLATSSVYLVNDLFDLESDRKHPEKRSRPFAAGTLPIAAGLALAPALLGASVAVSALVGPRVSASVLIYVALVVAYSLKVKRIAMADVILLSGFYTMRVLAGGIATAIPISPWLMMLSTFLFLSLAVAKRHSELVATGAPVGQAVPGRDYCAADAPVVLALGVSSGTVAALVLALYVRSDLGATLYARPEWLYGLVPLLLFWLGRLWLISGRGQLDADPLMFTLRDRTSWALLGLAMFVAYLAGPS